MSNGKRQARLSGEEASRLFENGVAHWREHSEPQGGKLIIVTSSQAEAEVYVSKLRDAGVRSALAGRDREQEIREFRHSPAVKALVACPMALEGLDVPAATHLICLTRPHSATQIEHLLARVWRANPG